MAEIKYHVVFNKPRQLIKFFIILFIGPSGFVVSFVWILNLLYGKFAWKDIFMFTAIIILFGVFLSVLITLNERVKGADIPRDEFILYDNGWFVFWCVEPDEGWIAPAKLEWVLPKAKPIKELEKEIGYRPNRWYTIGFKWYLWTRKKRGNKYRVVISIPWTYPYGKWKDWVFFGEAGGWIDENNYKKLKELEKMIEEKAKENIERGRIKIPGKNVAQENFGHNQLAIVWNDVFVKENIREIYMKETGEDIPEPVRSFLYDYEKFKKVYLKNKRETGDWFGRKNQVRR